MDMWQLIAIISLIAGIICIGYFIEDIAEVVVQKIDKIITKIKIQSKIECLKEINYNEPMMWKSKIYFPKESTTLVPSYKISEYRPKKIFGIDVQESIDNNSTITFFTAKKCADDKARIWHKDSKLVYSMLTSYDVFMRTDGEPYIRTYSWAYLYRNDKEFLLIHMGTDLKPIGHYYSWTETDEKNLAKYPFMSEDCLKIDSDRIYKIAEENGVFLYKGTLVLISVNILDRYGPYWVLNGRYFLNPKTEELIDAYSESERPHEIKIDDKVHYTITYRKLLHLQQDIAFNQEVDFKTGNVVLDEYGMWTNVYEYDIWSNIVGIAIRARTIDKSNNQTLATMEIRFRDRMIFYSEKHFENTNVVYEGSGEINIATGYKQKEQVISGEKDVEYYHAWPVGKTF